MHYENYDPSFPDQPVVDLYLPIWATLPAFRYKPAFVWTDDSPTRITSTLTYYQLNASVQTISSNLLIQLQRGDTVVVLCSPGLELVEVIFGCQRAGLLSVPVIPPDPSFAKENYHHLVRVLSQTKPKVAIAQSDYIASVRLYISSLSSNKNLVALLQNLLWISTNDIKKDIGNMDVKFNPLTYNGCKPEETYLIQYTSGATGIPKPVLVTAGSAAHNVRAARKAYDLHPNSVTVSWLPQYHDCGLMFVLLTIVSGATCVLASPFAFLNRPRLWLELVSDFKATNTPVPSFALPLVVKRGGVDSGTSPINLSNMKNLIIVNEPIYMSAIEEFVHVFSPFGLNPSSISPSYGLAENGTFVSTSWRSQLSNFTSSQGIPFPTYSKLLPSARLSSRKEDEDHDIVIAVVNEETHEVVEDGVEGEIWVSSPSNCSGYLGHPSLTSEVFNRKLRNKDGWFTQTFLRTADRGIVEGKERYLFVTGRCSDIIKLQDKREIHPHFIETAAYNSSPRLLRGGCLVAFKMSRTIVLVAELQRKETDSGVLERLCEGIRKAVLREEKVEIGLVVLVENGCVPKTTSGKLQRWAAQRKLVEGKMRTLVEKKFGESDCFLSLSLSSHSSLISHL